MASETIYEKRAGGGGGRENEERVRYLRKNQVYGI